MLLTVLVVKAFVVSCLWSFFLNEAEEPSPVTLDRGGIAAEAGGMYVLREGKELD